MVEQRLGRRHDNVRSRSIGQRKLPRVSTLAAAAILSIGSIPFDKNTSEVGRASRRMQYSSHLSTLKKLQPDGKCVVAVR